MFIIVKYGQNETLLCNPMCAIVNLLNSIKKRAGYGNSSVIVDLSDETGLVKELDLHKYDSATKYLNSHETYILVQKEQLQDNLSVDSGSPIDSKNYQYTPLLEQYENLFPNFKVHVDHIATPKIKKRGGKSPSPAGRFTSKPKKSTESGTSKKTSGKRSEISILCNRPGSTILHFSFYISTNIDRTLTSIFNRNLIFSNVSVLFF